MASSRRLLLAAAVAAGALGPAACGSGKRAPARHASAGAQRQERRQQAQADPSLQPPANVPQRAAGPADPRSARVIRAWLRALDSGDIGGAADFFAQPSRFQNGTPVIVLRNRTDRVDANLALTCGARAVQLGRSGAFTIVTFVLVDRPGGECGSGVGQSARGAIRVTGGKIREWYRLPDLPAQQQTAPAGPAL